jgi:hypothetical protein
MNKRGKGISNVEDAYMKMYEPYSIRPEFF